MRNETATTKMSVPGANQWVMTAEVADALNLILVVDGKKMPSSREQMARLYVLAAELEMRSEGKQWVINLRQPELAGGHLRVMGIRIETATGAQSEMEAATTMLKQMAKEISTSVFRFHFR
ncbi:hypothetical protein [Nitrospira sp. Nam74]